jgi:hypothetical protein
MDQQLALLMALLSGGGSMGSSSSNSGVNTGATSSMPGNSDILQALQGFSPVNVNPNYGSTVNRFFNRSPLAGGQAFTGANALQSGASGNNAFRGGTGHSSFLPTDFGSSMQKWTM